MVEGLSISVLLKETGKKNREHRVEVRSATRNLSCVKILRVELLPMRQSGAMLCCTPTTHDPQEMGCHSQKKTQCFCSVWTRQLNMKTVQGSWPRNVEDPPEFDVFGDGQYKLVEQ